MNGPADGDFTFQIERLNFHSYRTEGSIYGEFSYSFVILAAEIANAYFACAWNPLRVGMGRI